MIENSLIGRDAILMRQSPGLIKQAPAYFQHDEMR
jgi:hypothetical protein